MPPSQQDDDKDKKSTPGGGGLNPTKEEVDSLHTTRNYIIGLFVLGAVAGQVLVARRNTSHLKEIAKRKGVKFEAPKRNKKDDDDWF